MFFDDIVDVKRADCANYFVFVYHLPCQLNKDIIEYFKSFGKPSYPIDIINLLKIIDKDGYKIDGKIGKNVIKFNVPKKIGNNPNKWRELEFKLNLASWISKTLGLEVYLDK